MKQEITLVNVDEFNERVAKQRALEAPLEAEIYRLNKEIETVKAVEIEPRRLKAHRLSGELASLRTGISKGDVIEWRLNSGSGKRRGVVQIVKPFCCGGEYEFGVYRMLKGGKVNPKIIWVHHWSDPRKVEGACTPDLLK